MTTVDYLGIAYLCTALVVGSYATYLNRGLFRRATKRHFRMALHVAIVGILWPLLATAAIASLRD